MLKTASNLHPTKFYMLIDSLLLHIDFCSLPLCFPSGMHRGNIARDMARSCSRSSTPAPLYDIRVPIFSVKSKPFASKGWETQPMLLPHEFMGWMFKHHPQRFHRHLLGFRSPDSVVKFWKSFPEGDVVIWGHPCMLQDSPLDKLIPLVSHTEGVPVTKSGAGSMSLAVTSPHHSVSAAH
jgi:hypothetical protein